MNGMVGSQMGRTVVPVLHFHALDWVNESLPLDFLIYKMNG
jgi:hypothetical protein